jgi:acetyltransferase-like isoleucine patch superfamily enzyme
MKLLERCNTFRYLLLDYINRRQLTACGEDTLVYGRVERRHPLSSVRVGRGCLLYGRFATETEQSTITIGNNVFVGSGSSVDCAASIEIEDDVLISYDCVIMDSNNHSLRYSIRKHDTADWKNGRRHDWSTTDSRPVRICRGAWLGARAVVLKGVTVGDGAIVATASVVTTDVSPWTIVAGNPARLVREIGLDER